MSGRVLLAGILADPAMLAALGLEPRGEPVALPGRLSAAPSAGLGANGWPRWDSKAAGHVTAVAVDSTPDLARYAAIMGLAPALHGDTPVLGVGDTGDDATGEADPRLAAEIAADLLAQHADQTPENLRARLPMIAWRAASRLRAQAERGAPDAPGPAEPDRVRIEARATPYARYFAVEELLLRHRLHLGGWSDPLLRAVFVSGDAVVVLPWDPVRDRVLLVDQLRAGPVARGDAQPWLYEPVAGRIDPGETPESTARREAMEEAGVTLGALFPVPGHYPSPGIIAEFIYGFVGVADLPDDAATVSGLDAEGEDIRGHLVDRAELTRMALDGRIVNGPLLILALWLDRMADRLRAADPPR